MKNTNSLLESMYDIAVASQHRGIEKEIFLYTCAMARKTISHTVLNVIRSALVKNRTQFL